jgi:hypothetical protein
VHAFSFHGPAFPGLTCDCVPDTFNLRVNRCPGVARAMACGVRSPIQPATITSCPTVMSDSWEHTDG